MKCVERAYYYPYSGIDMNRLDAIKQYLLYYEDVSILGFGFELMETDMIYIENSPEAKNDVAELRKAGLLNVIQPDEVIRKHSSSFFKETIEDIVLLTAGHSEGPVKWRWNLSDPKITNEIARALGLSKKESRWQNMSYSQGIAILLNHAFFNCMEYNLAPFTDEDLHHRAFNLKIIRHAKELHTHEKASDILDMDKLPSPLREKEIMKYTLTSSVPIWPAPHVIRIEQLLEFRKNTHNTRKCFRYEIAKLAQEIAKSPSEYSPEKQIDRYIYSHLNDLDSALRAIEVPNFEEMNPPKTALKGMFVSIGKTAIPILDLVFRVARARKEGLTSKEYRKLKNNGLFYLLEINRRFPHAP